MTSPRVYLIGIAGGTCSGKSLLALYLKNSFREKHPVVMSCDSYYRDLATLPPAERATRNFDDPEAIELELLSRHLEILAGGGEILRPVYDFSSHTRTANPVRVVPGKLIIVEGLFVLYWDEIRRLINTKVFVTLSEGNSLYRRLERDVRERGRTQESVLNQYNQTVKPMTDKYVLPTSAFADILVSGSDPIEQSAARVMSHIRFPL